MEGTTDHFDSVGNAGRYGDGDLQWVTAGAGLQHSEMFPLRRSDAPNTLRLFQLWLNLPQRNKMAPPSFLMHWHEAAVRLPGAGGAVATLVTGQLGDVDSGCQPPPATNSSYMAMAPCRTSNEAAPSIGAWSWPATTSVWVASFGLPGFACRVAAPSELVNTCSSALARPEPMASMLPMAKRRRLKARRDSTVVSPGLTTFTLDHNREWSHNCALSSAFFRQD